jgi:hypothetical protein
MNRIAGIVLIAVGVAVLGPVASAQSNCKDAKGNFVEVYPGGDTSTGTITNGGWLDGTTTSVFFGTAQPGPVPTQVTFADKFTLTTGLGVLKGTRTYLFDFVAQKAVTMMIIDPSQSSGIFTGATGALYISLVKLTPGATSTTFDEEITGQLCFAR